MADFNLTQADANALMRMEKRRVDDTQWQFPQPGGRLAIPLASADRRESFVLDVTRACVKLTKATFQNRARATIILLRLDLDGSPHRNPDGEEIACPHLHRYREGFGDKWAELAPAELGFPDLLATLEAFMKHCNVTEPPSVEGSLF